MADPQSPAKPPVDERKPVAEHKPVDNVKTLVVALTRGYYGGLIRERGDRFEIAADTDLGGWMDPVNPGDIKRLAPALAKRPRPAPPIGKNVKSTPAAILR